ncbi:uncharacterized protein LOC132797247 [Drosophila nasuta]|uniref:Uncharacterized protein LOC127565776 isoform X1 n=1 Tax=Drosophila albomicans TaxID=7291 RepID=A0A9C6SUI1_DROAB|nr:uncharacterized protein LOC127565776 isoform X1 [Drosophila albomicans]XP_051862138.1 uncharacterized protein LOC127565776 isoform X2 [Drosophila albomicans]XP_060664858.1 uncharacterized protein LOC132797247 [Drosophila nasuta]
MSTMTEEDRKMAVYTANRKKYNYTLAVLMAMRNDFEPEKFLSLYDDIHNRYPMLIHNHVIDTAIIIWKKCFVVPDKDVSFYYRELYKYHFNMIDALNGDY